MSILFTTNHDRLAQSLRDNGISVGPHPAQATEMPEGYTQIVVIDNAPTEYAENFLAGGVDPLKIDVIWCDDYQEGPSELIGLDITELLDEAVGVYDHTMEPLEDYTRQPGDGVYHDPGADWARRNIRWRANGELVTVVGGYSSGKSLVTQYLAMLWCSGDGARYPDDHPTKPGQERERPVWMVTWEDQAHRQKQRIYNHYTCGAGVDGGSEGQLAQARKIASKIQYFRDLKPQAKDIPAFMRMALYASAKYGANFFIFDPWANFDHEHKERRDDIYQKKILDQLGAFARKHGFIVVVVTHITKDMYTKDGSILPFSAAHAVGSQGFGSSADRAICIQKVRGLSYHEPQRWITVLYFDKMKEPTLDEQGEAGEVVALKYEESNFLFQQDAAITQDAAEVWWNSKPGGICNGETRDGDKPQPQQYDQPTHVVSPPMLNGHATPPMPEVPF